MIHPTDTARPQPPRWIPWALFALGLAALLPSIWSETSVTCLDEYWRSFRTPMEMLERGEWLTPWCNGEPRLRKPPLLYWAILLNYKLLGVHLVSARLWGVLAGAGLAVCACLLARELFKSDGWLAGLLALGTIGVAVEARQAMLDLPLGLFAALSVLHWLRWLRRQKPLELLACAVWLGLSFLVKGPVGFFFFVTGALTALGLLRAWAVPARHPWHLALWLAAVAAICLPWPLLMQHLWADRFLPILLEEVAARHFGQWHGMSPFSALTGALGLVFPWTLLTLGATYEHLRQRAGSRPRATSWLIGWFLVSVLPFFFMKAFERYMLAVLPVQAVLVAQWLEGPAARLKSALLRLSAALLALLGLACCGFALWFRFGGLWPWVGWVVSGVILWRAFGPARPWEPALGASLAFAVCLGGVYPGLGISSLPTGLKQRLGGLVARHFSSVQPSMLSMHLGYSVQEFKPERLRGPDGRPTAAEVVFVEEPHRAAFLELVKTRQLQAEELGRLTTFYSRKAWLRFAREGVGWPDWQAAFRARSLESLKTEFSYYRVWAQAGS